MIKYDTYKDSGIEWLGEIPEHWEVNRLKNVFLFCTGLSITKKNLQDKGIPCVNYGEIHSKYGFEVDPNIHPLKCVEKSYLTTKKKALLSKGDFIFSDTSEDIEGSGNFTYLNSDTQTFAGYHTIVAKLQQKGNYRFIAYLLDSIDFRTQIQNNVAGIKVYSITQGLLKRLNIFFPPPKEQTTIANYLDRKTKAIDKKINLLTQKTAKYKELRKAIINQTVTKGLDKTVQLKDSGIEWIGEIPLHWKVKRLKDFFELSKGINSSKYNNDYVKDDNNQGYYPVYSGQTENSGVMAKINSYEYNYDKTLLLVTTVGANAMGINKVKGKFTLSQNCALMKINKKGFIHYQYYYLLQLFREERKIIPTIMQPSLRIEDLKKYFIIVPPIKEQTAIAQYLDEKTGKIDAIVSNIEKQINTLKELRKTLINDVVTGKIKVSG
jgi:type I restriction enzyme S subunit